MSWGLFLIFLNIWTVLLQCVNNDFCPLHNKFMWFIAHALKKKKKSPKCRTQTRNPNGYIVGLNLNSLDRIEVRFKPKLTADFFFFFPSLFLIKAQLSLFRVSIKKSRDEWTLLYITSPYFQTKTIQILLKHIGYVTITNFINNLMNITLGDWVIV